jgi:peptidyl-prolyl cis-trans isomerase A (cyclophilin A)
MKLARSTVLAPLRFVSLVPLVSLGAAPLLTACGKTEEPPSSQASLGEVKLPGAAPASAAPAVPSMPPAPAEFKVKFTTTKGDIVLTVHRAWSPNGADRFYGLVKMGYYDDTRFFRAVEGFMVQFGISGKPDVNKQWLNRGIPDDPVAHPNTRGTVTFAQANTPGSRTTQIFINLVDNSRLDPMRFSPFAEVTSGMDVVDALYKGYGEGAPMGQGPDQQLIQQQGNAYLDSKFPKLDGIKHAEVRD